MTRLFTLSLILIFGLLAIGNAQTYVIDDFETSAADSVYEANVEGPPSRIDMIDNTVDFVEGSASMDAHYVIGSFHGWGSFANLIYRTDDLVPMDWSISDSFSIWIKVQTAPTVPANMVFRIHIVDQPDSTQPIEEYIYENTTIFDQAAGWVELRIPFLERVQPGTEVPDDTGFILMPTSWGGGTYNNRLLDRDKIVGFNISAVTTGWDPNANLPADSVKISYDNFTRFGARAVPLIIFNGMALPSDFSIFSWGQSSFGVDMGTGATPGTNSIKWVQGNEWGNGWTGAGMNIGTPRNMLGSWITGDSVNFKLKAEAGVGDLRIQFEDGTGKVGHVFTPTADDQWHDYSLALQDFTFQDGTTSIDTSAITVAGIMAEASGVAGKVVYIDDWWTGNPIFDVIPPNPPTPVVVSPGTYSNLVTWLDPEAGAKYDIFFSESPISDVTAPGVGWAGQITDTPPSTFDHELLSPAGDSTVTYYYAVTATDEAGNISTPATAPGSVTNTARGVSVVSLTVPAAFNADGNLSEWSAITPIRLFPSEGAHIVTNTTVTNDNDLSVLTYVAVDNDYLYVAYDVTDDVLDNTNANSWEQDAPDLFIGLYDWRGRPHSSYRTTNEPDYHFRFNETQAIIDNLGGHVILSDSTADYSYTPKFPAGYIVEARISLSALAAVNGADLFVPVEGMRVPIDIAVNDADGGGVRQGIMTLSKKNEDTSWQNPSFWTYTWVGTRFNPIVGIEDENGFIIADYALEQNYPNPFNPTTTISYSLKTTGRVSLDVFNALGQKVQTIVNANQAPGVYTVNFDGRGLSSGIYFYRLNAGSFNQIKKMVLMK